MKNKILLFLAGLLISVAVFAQTTTHVVKAGETIKSIAAAYHVTEKALIEANPGLRPDFLIVGITIKIPAAPKKAQSSSTSAKSQSTGKSQQATAKAQTTEQPGTKAASGSAGTAGKASSASTGSSAAKASVSVPPAKKDTPQAQSPKSSSKESTTTVSAIAEPQVPSGQETTVTTDRGRGWHFSAAYGIPIMGQSRDYFDSNWALAFGLDYNGRFEDSLAFLSIGTDIVLNWQKPKGASNTTFVFNNYYPVQIGFGRDGFNARAGGFLGWGKSTGTKASFTYGFKFNVQCIIDVGFMLVWVPDSKTPGKMLSIGIRF